MRQLGRLLTAVAFTTILALAGCGGQTTQGGDSAGPVKLTETGSSLLYPLFNLWLPAYTKHHKVSITTQSTGSGTGLSDAINGTVQIGASDAYMSDTAVSQAPTMLNIPLAISAQQIMYNVPSLTVPHLRLSGPVLADIYTGKVTRWNDPKIAALNPGVKLPSLAIVPVHRTDGSGDTFLFTQYLSFSAPSWAGTYSYNTQWPGVRGGIGGVGNQGVVQLLAQNKGSVGYVGISWLDRATAKGLPYAALQNASGRFVLPDASSIGTAAAAKIPATPRNERISLIFATGAGSYPIINYEYAIVDSKQPHAEKAKALRDFLTWTLSASGGQSMSYLRQVHFQPLPESVLRLSRAQVARIR